MRRVVIVVRYLLSHATVLLVSAFIVAGGVAAASNPAQAAPAGRASAGVLPAPAPLRVNKANWSGKAGFGSREPAWYQDRSGVVHLQGALTQIDGVGRAASTLGTLPRAARPSRNVFTIVHTFDGTYADLEVARNGSLTLIGPRSPAVTDYSFVSLEGISYRPSGKTSPIPVNPEDWGPPGFGAAGPGWYKDRSGIVHLQGAVAPAQVGCTGFCFIGLLPKAARPARQVNTIVHTFDGTYGDLIVTVNGDLFITDPAPPLAADYSFISLESVTFRPSGPVTSIPVNRQNWGSPAPGLASEPAWFADRSGIIYLQGAAAQTASSGPDASTIGTLPPAARPARNVYTIVITGNGAYADLVIDHNGQINLISPRPPAVSGNTMVSLEGISYRR
jgi:hypothetical protein